MLNVLRIYFLNISIQVFVLMLCVDISILCVYDILQFNKFMPYVKKKSIFNWIKHTKLNVKLLTNFLLLYLPYEENSDS